jgi:hypothetical protein
MRVVSTGKFPEMNVSGKIHEVDDATGKILIEMGAATIEEEPVVEVEEPQVEVEEEPVMPKKK